MRNFKIWDLDQISVVGLVTFRRNKYMTVRTFKLGSGTRKNGNQMYSSNLGSIFNILSIWEKSVFSTIFVPVLRVFSRFTCKNGGFWVFFTNIGHIHGRKKTTSTWHLILKILQWFSFDLKTPNPMLNWLQYMQYSHNLIKTIHHESWYCKIMKNKMKILSYQK